MKIKGWEELASFETSVEVRLIPFKLLYLYWVSPRRTIRATKATKSIRGSIPVPLTKPT